MQIKITKNTDKGVWIKCNRKLKKKKKLVKALRLACYRVNSILKICAYAYLIFMLFAGRHTSNLYHISDDGMWHKEVNIEHKSV